MCVQTRRGLFEHHACEKTSTPSINQSGTDLNETQRAGDDNQYWTQGSDQLIQALGKYGEFYKRPKRYDWKVNLNHVEPSLPAQNLCVAFKTAAATQEMRSNLVVRDAHGLSRENVLTKYLLHVHPTLQREFRLKNPDAWGALLNIGLRKVFDWKTLQWLEARDLDITDIMDWAWILTAENIRRTAENLTLIADRPVGDSGSSKGVPRFLLNFILRHDSIDSWSLRLLLARTEKMLRESENSMPTLPNRESLRDLNLGVSRSLVRNGFDCMSQKTFITIMTRLLRSARKVWPAACVNIATLFARYMDGVNFGNDMVQPSGLATSDTFRSPDMSQLSFLYNTFIRLLSLPASIRPYESARYQRKAQFILVKRMAQFDPPLVLDQRGHQAIKKLQLMRKKTQAEKEWARLKGKSWPPWKEEKLGVDATIGVEYGISRAKQVSDRSEEAGYSPNNWDAAADILSGWDTDSSPTIQTRTVLRYPLDNPKKETRDAIVWAARIQATRTLEEAWSGFLQWKEETTKGDTGQPVYLAMFTKIMHSLRNTTLQSENLPTDFQPGDGPEVFPAPSSHGVYVRRLPPPEDELLKMMIDDGIKPSGRLLTFLVANATSFKFGLECLGASELQGIDLKALFNTNLSADHESRRHLKSIPKHFLAGFIQFLARFAPKMNFKSRSSPYDYVDTGLTLKADSWRQALGSKAPKLPTDKFQFNSLAQARYILRACKPTYRPSWYYYFQALVRSGAVTGLKSKLSNQDFQDILTWRLLRGHLKEMQAINVQLDLDGFKIMCTGFEKALFASERQQRFENASARISKTFFTNERRHRWEIRSRSQQLSQELSFVKKLFFDIVGTEQTSPEGCPRLLEVPNPAHLHAYIRILGLGGDHEGILHLVEWMCQYADEIDAVAEEFMNGKRMLRRRMIAIRVFLERKWTHVDGHDQSAYRSAPQDLIDKVRQMIKDRWATEEEVEEYCSKSKFI